MRFKNQGVRWNGWRSGMLLFFCGMVFQVHSARQTDANDNSIETAIVELERDLERDTDALNALRTKVAEERKPLAARLDELQKLVKERRTEVERIRHLRNQGEKEQAALEAEAEAVKGDCQFLSALFVEYARSMETRVGTAEAARLVKRLRPIQDELTNKEFQTGFSDAVKNLLALSASFNEDRLGGSLFAGIALDQTGIEQTGNFAVFGPLAYFAAKDAGAAGLAIIQFGAAQPAIYDRLPEESADAIRKLTKGSLARVPVDMTDGDAVKVADSRPSLLEHMKKGGFVMYPLLLVAVAAFILTLFKTIELSGIHVKPGREIDEVIEATKRNDIDAALQLANNIKQPLRALVLEAVEHRDLPRDHLEEIMHEHVLKSLPWLERNLGTLAALGGIAPLLGLLGTVTGMIHTFQLVTIFGSGDAKLLSGGISEALVTTEAGLAIAIPVLLVHAFLVRRARNIIGALECMAVSIVNDLKTRSANE